MASKILARLIIGVIWLWLEAGEYGNVGEISVWRWLHFQSRLAVRIVILIIRFTD